MVRFLTGLALSAIAGLTGVNAIPTISVKGSKFFTSEGNQFYVKGMFWLHEMYVMVANRIRQASRTNSFPTTRSSPRRNAVPTPRS
jgi:hypothetical protein